MASTPHRSKQPRETDDACPASVVPLIWETSALPMNAPPWRRLAVWGRFTILVALLSAMGLLFHFSIVGYPGLEDARLLSTPQETTVVIALLLAIMAGSWITALNSTRRRDYLRALQAHSQTLGSLANAVQDALIMINSKGQIQVWNESATRMFGWQPEEALGHRLSQILVPTDDGDTTIRRICQLAAGTLGETLPSLLPTTVQTQRDSAKRVEFTFSQLQLGETTFAVGTARDIGERQRALAALAASERRFRAIFQQVNECILLLTPDGIVLEANETAVDFCCRNLQQVQGTFAWDVLRWTAPDTDRKALQRYVQQAAIGLEARYQITLGRASSDNAILDLNVRPIHNQYEQIVMLLIVGHDITAREEADRRVHQLNAELEERVRKRTQELVRARNEAESANRAKSAFLANMSHEIRTPLNAVMGFSQLLLMDSQATPQQQEHLSIILRSGDHLLSLINDVLDMAKLQAGRLDLQSERFDLQAVIDDLHESHLSRAHARGLAFRVQPLGDLPRYVRGDQRKIRQVLANLISNAIKYTREGEVRLSISGERQGESANLVITVKDTGPGISQEDQERIFNAFEQVDTCGKGIGLGLSISRALARHLGGDLTCESEVGHGASFHFLLQLEEDAAPPLQPRRHHTLSTLIPDSQQWRILVVDDSADNRLLLMKILTNAGFQLREAENGLRALEQVEQWAPHAAFVDLSMPVMDGAEAIASIRDRADGSADMVLVGITAHANQEQSELMLNAGADHVMHKPFNPRDALQVLIQYLDCDACAPTEDSDAPAADPPLADAPTADAALAELPSLPSALLADLHEAALGCDSDRLEELLHAHQEQAPQMVASFRRCIHAFDYETILNTLEEVTLR